jgi:hypothetical protein
MLFVEVRGGTISIDESVYPLVLYKNGRALRTFEAYKSYLAQVLSIENEKTVVDCNEINLLKDFRCPYKAEGIKQYINSTLLALGFLTQNREGAWSFIDNNFNPVVGTPDSEYYPHKRGTAFFAKEEDIIKYGDANYEEWTIFQMKGLRSRQEICL